MGILNFLEYLLPTSGTESSVTAFNTSSILFSYPCQNSNDCGPITILLQRGHYRIENWGASGGIPFGGNGGYVSGILSIPHPQNLYFYIGKEGDPELTNNGRLTFNGGGDSGIRGGGTGGGATDIRLTISSDKNWQNFESLKSRIMVAGAGGGGTNDLGYPGNGGSGGGLEGLPGSDRNVVPGGFPITEAMGGTQTSGGALGYTPQPEIYCSYQSGKFGVGGSVVHGSGCRESKYYGGGGGGGYYGGAAGVTAERHVGTGAGGSSFISGHPESKAIDPASTESNIVPFDHSNHYSEIVFRDPVMIDGNSKQPSPNKPGEFEENGHFGNGAIRITFVAEFSKSKDRGSPRVLVGLLLHFLILRRVA